SEAAGLEKKLDEGVLKWIKGESHLALEEARKAEETADHERRIGMFNFVCISPEVLAVGLQQV
ncbi:hypothetical protein ACJX0J_037461, partial [Zea mays]